MKLTKEILIKIIKEAIENMKKKKTENVGMAIDAVGTVASMVGSKDEQEEQISRLKIKKNKNKKRN